MAIGLSLPPPPALVALPTTSHHHQSTTTHTVRPTACTCGARAYHDDRQRRRRRRIAPIGVAGLVTLRAMEHDRAKHHEDEEDDQDHDHPTQPERKRSLWRKILCKGPKCICEQLHKDRPQLIQIPSEYDGCLTVRVAGKRVPYSREMQQIKRSSYTPMDAIAEEEEDANH